MGKRNNKRHRISYPAHLAVVAEHGCIICGCPAEVHHINIGLGMGQRGSDLDTIPLCPKHHRTGNIGTAVHSGRKSFEKNFGTEKSLLERYRDNAFGGEVSSILKIVRGN